MLKKNNLWLLNETQILNTWFAYLNKQFWKTINTQNNHRYVSRQLGKFQGYLNRSSQTCVDVLQSCLVVSAVRRSRCKHLIWALFLRLCGTRGLQPYNERLLLLPTTATVVMTSEVSLTGPGLQLHYRVFNLSDREFWTQKILTIPLLSHGSSGFHLHFFEMCFYSLSRSVSVLH